jgi:hypothetical protein
MAITLKEARTIEKLINTLETSTIMRNLYLRGDDSTMTEKDYIISKNMYNQACKDLEQFNIRISGY